MEFEAQHQFEPKDPNFHERVSESFAQQTIMKTIGASLTSCEPGHVHITLPYDKKLCQQHGFIHGGIIATILDSACGYSAFSLMPVDAEVLSIEFKTNLLAPAKGTEFRAIGKVVKSGRTISVAEGSLYAMDIAQRKLIATMNCTLMEVHHHQTKRK
jgi:uncharacterized protein (TIGR00369 family)